MEEAERSESEEEEEEEQLVLDASLAAAALKSTAKSKAKVALDKVNTSKKVVNAQLLNIEKSAAAKTAAKKNSITKLPRRRLWKLPYIVRALLNPWTAWAMTRTYWASLFQVNYVQERLQSQAQGLRSALEEKAKRNSGGPPPKGRRKKTMKRGQAKTLSDLPQLSS